MKISPFGLAIIKYFEGFSAEPYLCSAGVATIGYGSTYYKDGTSVTLDDEPITEKDALALLELTVNDEYSITVDSGVLVEVNQQQFDAMVSLTYNIGSGAFLDSTLLEYCNMEDHQEAADEFLSWVYANGEVIQGLVNRREVERALYLYEQKGKTWKQ